jgi:hypothetical protein
MPALALPLGNADADRSLLLDTNAARGQVPRITVLSHSDGCQLTRRLIPWVFLSS